MSSPVRVIIPAHPRYLRIARLTAAGIAGDLGFGLQDIEDLRVAIDEMCAVLIDDADPATQLELSYVSENGSLTIEGRCSQTGLPPEIHPVARELLAMTADEFSVDSDGEGRRFRLVKRPTPQPA